MNDRPDFERRLAELLARTADPRTTHGQSEAVTDRVAATRQLPAMLAAFRGGDGTLERGRGRTPSLATSIALVAAAALIIVAIAAALSGGPHRLAVTPVASDSASPATASSSIAASAAPSASGASSPLASGSPSPSADASGSPTASGKVPDLSRLGTLAYVHTPPGPWDYQMSDLYLANPDGSSSRLFVDGIDSAGGWSPSGSYLTVMTVTADDVSTIRIVDRDGHEAGRIVGPSASAVWAPTDDRLAVTTVDATSTRLGIYRPDGSLIRRLSVPSPVTNIGNLAWAPTGDRLVIEGAWPRSGSGIDSWDLWMVPVDGGRAKRITTAPGTQETYVAWAPDGSVIAYWSGCEPASSCDMAIWAIRPDGSDRHEMILGAGGGPTWSHDGRTIAFARTVRGDADHVDVWVADPDGSNDHRITTALGEDYPVGWSADDSVVMSVHHSLIADGSDQTGELDAVAADGSGSVRLAEQGAWGDWGKAGG